MTQARPRVGFVGPETVVDAVRAALGDGIETVAIPVDAAALREALPELDGLVEATTRLPLDAEAFASAPRLRIVSIAGTGDAHVDRDAAAACGVEVRSLVEDRELLETLDPTAEHTWGLLLACIRQVSSASRHVLDGGWERERFPGMLLSGRRLGIVGLGRLGRKVARYGRAFGMDVVAHDPGVPADDAPDAVPLLDLDTVLATSDVVSLHVPLDASTRGLIDRARIALMRPDAVLVNTSRGALIDEAALADAIRGGRLAGAALDVLADEPPADDHPLLVLAREDARVLITPHLGGFVPEVLETVCVHAAGKVREHLSGGAA